MHVSSKCIVFPPPKCIPVVVVVVLGGGGGGGVGLVTIIDWFFLRQLGRARRGGNTAFLTRGIRYFREPCIHMLKSLVNLAPRNIICTPAVHKR